MKNRSTNPLLKKFVLVSFRLVPLFGLLPPLLNRGGYDVRAIVIASAHVDCSPVGGQAGGLVGSLKIPSRVA